MTCRSWGPGENSVDQGGINQRMCRWSLSTNYRREEPLDVTPFFGIYELRTAAATCDGRGSVPPSSKGGRKIPAIRAECNMDAGFTLAGVSRGGAIEKRTWPRNLCEHCPGPVAEAQVADAPQTTRPALAEGLAKVGPEGIGDASVSEKAGGSRSCLNTRSRRESSYV